MDELFYIATLAGLTLCGYVLGGLAGAELTALVTGLGLIAGVVAKKERGHGG